MLRLHRLIIPNLFEVTLAEARLQRIASDYALLSPIDSFTFQIGNMLPIRYNLEPSLTIFGFLAEGVKSAI